MGGVERCRGADSAGFYCYSMSGHALAVVDEGNANDVRFWLRAEADVSGAERSGL